MNTNIYPVSRDEKYLGIDAPKSKILEKSKSLFGKIPMAHFKSGEYGNNYYTVKPLGWRRYFIFNGWTFPYFIMSKPKWSIEIKPKGAGALPLRDFDIYENFPPFRVKNIQTHKNIGENVLRFDFTNERDLSDRGKAQYWLGEVGSENSFLLVEIDVIHGDNVFLYVVIPVISSVIGGVIGAVLTIAFGR